MAPIRFAYTAGRYTAGRAALRHAFTHLRNAALAALMQADWLFPSATHSFWACATAESQARSHSLTPSEESAFMIEQVMNGFTGSPLWEVLEQRACAANKGAAAINTKLNKAAEHLRMMLSLTEATRPDSPMGRLFRGRAHEAQLAQGC